MWRGAASGNLGGWQVARALQFLTVLTASVGTPGGTSPHGWNKYKPVFWEEPPGQKEWNELLFPREWPLSHYEMSFLLPHFLKEGRGQLDIYFTRVYNPVWTNPDGMTWMEVLQDESLVGLHAALTPTWSETAAFADYVLPMGHGGERHDIQSQETQSGRWVSFRQPVLRAARERLGETLPLHLRDEPRRGLGRGRVLDRAVSWRIDPDGALGIRRWFESPYEPGEKLTVHEYYRWIFENAVPGLPAAAAAEGLTPFEYMRALRRVPHRAGRARPAGEGRPTAPTIRHGRGRSETVGVKVGGSRRVPDAVAEARGLLADDGGLGLAGPGAARLHPSHVHRVGAGPRERARWCCCPRSACPPSSTPAAATRST